MSFSLSPPHQCLFTYRILQLFFFSILRQYHFLHQPIPEQVDVHTNECYGIMLRTHSKPNWVIRVPRKEFARLTLASFLLTKSTKPKPRWCSSSIFFGMRTNFNSPNTRKSSRISLRLAWNGIFFTRILLVCCSFSICRLRFVVLLGWLKQQTTIPMFIFFSSCALPALHRTFRSFEF